MVRKALLTAAVPELIDRRTLRSVVTIPCWTIQDISFDVEVCFIPSQELVVQSVLSSDRHGTGHGKVLPT